MDIFPGSFLKNSNMESTTVLTQKSRLLAHTEHMGYLIEIYEVRSSADDVHWSLPYQVSRLLVRQPPECWEHTSVYHMTCLPLYRKFNTRANVICYMDRTTRKLVHYCELCDPYLQFAHGRHSSPKQIACSHSRWFSLYIDQV